MAYAMVVLFLIGFAAVPFSLETYFKKREPRHLYLLSFGWLAYALSYPPHAIDSDRWATLLDAAFGSLQVLGVSLLVAGALSYFISINASRFATGATIVAAAVFVGLWAFPDLGGVVILAENVMLLTAAAVGISQPREFKAVGGTSYYWLLVLLPMGVIAALLWLPYVTTVPAEEPLWPWVGTTAVAVAMVLFMVQLEYNATLRTLYDREAELREHRVNLEALVDARTARLREATEAKSRFLARMSHELRTPLNSIIGFSGTLRQGLAGPLNAEQETQVEMISVAGKHLLELIDDILDISRIEAGGHELEMCEVDPAAVVEEALKLTRPLAESKSLQLHFETDWHDAAIQTDRARLRQILINLIGNAIKFTDHGSVRVAMGRSGREIEFTISDTGVGIEPSVLPTIFDAFVQGNPDAAEGRGGTGLGLAISREHALSLGGDISVWSQPGQGTIFTLRVPV